MEFILRFTKRGTGKTERVKDFLYNNRKSYLFVPVASNGHNVDKRYSQKGFTPVFITNITPLGLCKQDNVWIVVDEIKFLTSNQQDQLLQYRDRCNIYIETGDYNPIFISEAWQSLLKEFYPEQLI